MGLAAYQVSLEPAHDLHRHAQPIGGFAEAVAFVGEEHVAHRNSALLQMIDHLLCLHHWNIGVVGAVHHQGGRFDRIEIMDGREPAQKIGLGLGITVFDFRDGGHPGLRLRKEGLEVDHSE